MSKRIVTHRLSLDLESQKLQATITLGYGDLATHRLVVDLRHGADVLELSPGSYAIAVQGDDADVLDSVTVYSADSAYPNCLVYDVSTAVTSKVGVHEARFLISRVDEAGAQMTLTSPKIAFVVKEGILQGSAVTVSEPYSAVVLAREEAEKFAKNASDSAAAAETSEINAADSAAAAETSEINAADSADAAKKAADASQNTAQRAVAEHNSSPMAHANLRTATKDQDGLMSAEQARHLETLVKLLSNDDANITINTISEVLAAFEGYENGTQLANLLASKLPTSHDSNTTAHSELFSGIRSQLASKLGIAHNADADAHEDIREDIAALAERVEDLKSGSGGSGDSAEDVLIGTYSNWDSLPNDLTVGATYRLGVTKFEAECAYYYDGDDKVEFGIVPLDKTYCDTIGNEWLVTGEEGNYSIYSEDNPEGSISLYKVGSGNSGVTEDAILLYIDGAGSSSEDWTGAVSNLLHGDNYLYISFNGADDIYDIGEQLRNGIYNYDDAKFTVTKIEGCYAIHVGDLYSESFYISRGDCNDTFCLNGEVMEEDTWYEITASAYITCE